MLRPSQSISLFTAFPRTQEQSCYWQAAQIDVFMYFLLWLYAVLLGVIIFLYTAVHVRVLIVRVSGLALASGWEKESEVSAACDIHISCIPVFPPIDDCIRSATGHAVCYLNAQVQDCACRGHENILHFAFHFASTKRTRLSTMEPVLQEE